MRYPMYCRGTSTQDLQRGHLALTRREASTRRMAFLTTISSTRRTTMADRQTGHRSLGG
jgi:hypothetical protein